jgi:hypothetical protein
MFSSFCTPTIKWPRLGPPAPAADSAISVFGAVDSLCRSSRLPANLIERVELSVNMFNISGEARQTVLFTIGFPP